LRSFSPAQLSPEIPAGLPSEPPQRRPDVPASDQWLIAANANIGASHEPSVLTAFQEVSNALNSRQKLNWQNALAASGLFRAGERPILARP